MMQQRIYVIDDDQKLNQLLIDYLENFGFKVDSFTHPHDGIKRIQHDPPDLIILDIMLPDMDGFEACKEIRKTSQVPIIMLTARGEVMDRIVGLELGADDYLPKPFEPRELVARIQSVLRRGKNPVPQEKMIIGTLSIDFGRQQVLFNGEDLLLTTMEFELLSLFVRNMGRVLSRDQIMDTLRGMEWDAFDRSVDVLLSRLRQKLKDDPKNPQWIKTVWGAGYKFIGEDTDVS